MKTNPFTPEDYAALTRKIAAYEVVSTFGPEKVKITFTKGDTYLFNGSLKRFYDLILVHLGISVSQRKIMAAKVLSPKQNNRIMLPIVIEPRLSFMVFKRKQGPFYVNRCFIN